MSEPARSVPRAVTPSRAPALVEASAHRPLPEALPVNLGAVFTRRWVVELILDLAGYAEDEDLAEHTALEPACGKGAFLVPMVERLHASCRRHGRDIRDARAALIAVDVDQSAVQASRAEVSGTLRRLGVHASTATSLARQWIRQADFLTCASELSKARWVIGNPPYVRLEEVRPDDMVEYRRRWTTMSGRADLYVGFLEAGLSLLEPEGRLAVICPDRWMRNRYGAALRAMVETEYAVDACLVMHEVAAFENTVSAYPAVTVLRAGEQRQALVSEAGSRFDAETAARFLSTWRRGPAPVALDAQFRAAWTTGWFRDVQSWPAGTPERLTLLTDLESRLPTLADAGVKVGVGVATGADDVYVVPDPAIVEKSRSIPTLSARETATGSVQWAGRHLINPWDEHGLVDRADYPLMDAYLSRNAERLKARHVAQRRPAAWWRTIDRIAPAIATTPKLLIPDLKDRLHPVLDTGTYYPLHNMYYVTAPDWDLEVLGGLLMSDVANFFIESYSVRMANGYLRVSAQYLRRVRIPAFDSLDEPLRERLRVAFRGRDVPGATRAALTAYDIEFWPQA